MKELTYPAIMGGVTYAGLHYVFSVRKTPALIVGVAVGIAAFFTIRALEHPPGG